MEPGLDLRLPHPRGRLDRRAGARVHARRRLRLRGGGDRRAGSTSTTFAPRLSFFFNAHIDFFEEIAKYRAARRIWARDMRERYGAKDPRSWLHALPHADRRRVADRAAARGEQRRARRSRRSPRCSAARSRCTRTRYDEALALPTEHAVKLALRTQQVIAHETGVALDDRPARRLLLRRGPDQPARGRGATTTSTGSASWAA